jgi:3alpha(or 20beta)-hydroxysteroid dehydrogenase
MAQAGEHQAVGTASADRPEPGTGRLAGKVAIITGAARGQGEAEARLFAREGASVVATDVLGDLVSKVAEDIALDGFPAVALEHDISDPQAWDAVLAATVERFGGVDVLVNNAAVHWVRPLSEETLPDLRRMLDVNLLGPILGMQRAVEAMRERGGGSIVNISSYAGLRGIHGHGAYGASKWALRGVTKTAAIEFGPIGVRVNSVHPGSIETAMLPDFDEEPSIRFAHVPVGRVGQVDEVAELVLFLASDASSYLTGAEIAIDGGISAGRAAR